MISNAAAIAPTERLAGIQALRAIAVAMVIAFHLWPGTFTGGYAGVDVFFVISGFLITAHLLRERQRTGTIALRRFWARRIARLFPAALLVLAVTLAAMWLWLPATRWQRTAMEVVASTFYVENWRVAADAVDYFASAAAATPVQHYWSLSVEEQFYLVWPLLVLLGARLGSARAVRGVAAVLGLVLMASLAWSVLASLGAPEAAYFSTFTRAWEFAAGALLAVAGLGAAAPRRARLASLAAWAGLAGLAATTFLFDAGSRLPGHAALLPVLSTVAVIAAGLPTTRWSPAALLRLRPLQWVGGLAYPAYLWHWPLIVVFPFAMQRDAGNVDLLAIAAVTLLLSWLTSITLEHRFRSSAGRSSTWPVYAAALAASVTLALVSAMAWRAVEPDAVAAASPASAALQAGCVGAASMRPGANCREKHRRPPLDRVLAAPKDGGAVWLYARAENDPFFDRDCVYIAEKTQECVFPRFAQPSLELVLVGDSHLLQHIPTIAALARVNRWNIYYYMSLGCPPAELPGSEANDSGGRAACADWRRQVPARIAARRNVDLVIATSSTRHYANGVPPSAMEPLAKQFEATWRMWTASGKRVLVIADNPVSYDERGVAMAGPDCIAASSTSDDPCATPRARSVKRDPVDIALARTRLSGVSGADFTWAFCDATTCHAVVGGLVTHLDADHVTAAFNLTLMPELGDAILKAAGRDPATLVLPAPWP